MEFIDSLKNILRITEVDTFRISAMDDLTWEYLYSEIDSAKKYAKGAVSLSEKINNQKWIAICNQSLATVFFQTTSFDSAIIHFEIAKNINEKLGLKDKLCSNYNGMGNVNLQRGNYKKALDNYLIAVKLAEESGNKKKAAIIISNIALIYHNLHNYDKSQEYNLKSLKTAEEINDEILISGTYTNIANLYKDMDSLEQAEEYHLKSLKITHRLNLVSRTAQTYNNLALLYEKKNEFAKARKFLNDAIKLHLQMDNSDGMITSCISLGQIYSLEKNYEMSLKYFLDALENAKKLDVKERTMTIYDNLHTVYSAMHDFPKAYEYLSLYSAIKDTMLNMESSKQIAEMQTIYETEKRQKEIELQNAQLEKQNAEIHKQKILNYSFGVGIVMLLTVAFLIFRSYRQKKKSHFEIEKRNLKLQKANEEISLQKEIIEEKNKDILDSIRYAKRIQQAILPPEKFIKKHLPESFVLYKPKDIVAGDFYWMHVIPEIREQGVSREKNPPDVSEPRGTNPILFAACDCTGHGVPGAFVSIVANNALNRAVNEFALTEPAKILDKVNEFVEESFAKSESEIKDGMDIALVKFQILNSKFNIEYAGANNPVWIFKNSTKEFLEIKANVQPIGKYINRHPFQNHTFELQKGDAIYIFTDGYADQFGGPKGKKFKYKQFQNLIISVQDKLMEEQKNIFDKTIDNWKGNLVQIDDICIFGFRI